MCPTKLWRRPAVVVTAWVVAVGTGFGLLLQYENRPGDGGRVGADWPADAAIAFDPGKANVVLAAHPHCPCTRATLEELARILAHCPGRARVRVLFIRPWDLPAGWERTDLWERAGSNPGVEVLVDPGGAVARQFGVRTSGHVLLFGAGGRLLFSGGITGARGPGGDNPGAASVQSLLMGEDARLTAAPVFGCSLQEPGACAAEEGETCRP